MAIDHDAVIEAEGEALADAADGADPASPVPATDWTLADLLAHVGRLTWFFAGRVAKANGGDFYETTVPEGGDPIEFFRDGLHTLRANLAEADPAIPVKTWAGEVPVAWLWRRMAHELTVHRWDAEAAVGTPAPIDPEVADDGIDELLDEFVGRLFDAAAFGGGTLHLHATDGDGEWFIRVGPDGVTWERAHEKGDVAVRGATADLLLVLWGRLPLDVVEVIGDADVVTRWRRATRF